MANLLLSSTGLSMQSSFRLSKVLPIRKLSFSTVLVFSLVFCLLVMVLPNIADSAPLLKRNSDGFSLTSNNKESSETSENNQSTLEEKVNQLRYEFFKQNETMQIKLQTLQGLLEEQNYQLERFKKAERNRYADLDRRISSFEANTAAPVGTAAGLADTLADEDEKTYSDAIQKVENKEYNAAIAELSLYLEFFPEGQYIAQANYWLGELYLALEVPEYSNAQKYFKTVVDTFPQHAKVPDSLYKLGMIELALKNTPTAKIHFEKLLSQFPNSASAALASTQLRQLN